MPSQQRVKSGRILGLDVGERWIGVAISDPGGILARPLIVVDRAKAGWEAILNLVCQHEVKCIVVGMPYSLEGRLGQQAQQVKDFVSQLQERTQIPVQEWDERFSTVAARRMMADARTKKARRDDAIAAAFILQSYLDSGQSSEVRDSFDD